MSETSFPWRDKGWASISSLIKKRDIRKIYIFKTVLSWNEMVRHWCIKTKRVLFMSCAETGSSPLTQTVLHAERRALITFFYYPNIMWVTLDVCVVCSSAGWVEKCEGREPEMIVLYSVTTTKPTFLPVCRWHEESMTKTISEFGIGFSLKSIQGEQASDIVVKQQSCSPSPCKHGSSNKDIAVLNCDIKYFKEDSIIPYQVCGRQMKRLLL